MYTESRHCVLPRFERQERKRPVICLARSPLFVILVVEALVHRHPKVMSFLLVGHRFPDVICRCSSRLYARRRCISLTNSVNQLVHLLSSSEAPVVSTARLARRASLTAAATKVGAATTGAAGAALVALMVALTHGRPSVRGRARSVAAKSAPEVSSDRESRCGSSRDARSTCTSAMADAVTVAAVETVAEAVAERVDAVDVEVRHEGCRLR